MKRSEAEALAHLATIETGLPAAAQQLGPAWIVAIDVQDTQAIIDDGYAYLTWRDTRLGLVPPSSAAPQSALGKIGWLFEVTVWSRLRRGLRRLLKYLPLRADDWDVLDGQHPSEAIGYQRGDGDVPTSDFGYRRTHPPR